MNSAYLTSEKPVLTVMLQYETPEEVISVIENSLKEGAEAFGLQVESLKPEYHTAEVYKKIFAAAKGLPVYVTYYRGDHNSGKTDDELAEGIASVEFRQPVCPVYQNVTALPTTDPEEIRRNLLAQLTAPVRWTQTVLNMAADGADTFIETGPGKVLQGLVSKIIGR